MQSRAKRFEILIKDYYTLLRSKTTITFIVLSSLVIPIGDSFRHSFDNAVNFFSSTYDTNCSSHEQVVQAICSRFVASLYYFKQTQRNKLR